MGSHYSIHLGQYSRLVVITLVGTDVRKLVRDGYPATQIVGCDLRQSYITSGYKLFDDKETCQIRFITSDVLALPADTSKGVTTTPINEVSSLSDLTGRVKHLYTGALFHLFDEDTQFAIALRLVTLLKRSPGAIVFGRHQGYEVEGLIDDHMGRYDALSRLKENQFLNKS